MPPDVNAKGMNRPQVKLQRGILR